MFELKPSEFDYERCVTDMLESVIRPFKITGIDFMVWWNESYRTADTEIVFYNIPSYRFKHKQGWDHYVDLSPEEACATLIEPFRIKVEEVRRNCDIPDTIVLGEN